MTTSLIPGADWRSVPVPCPTCGREGGALRTSREAPAALAASCVLCDPSQEHPRVIELTEIARFLPVAVFT